MQKDNMKMRQFINLVADNYIELSHDKVRDEYLYWKKRAQLLKDDLNEV